MLLWLAKILLHWYHGFQVLHYLTLRTILSVLASFFISLLLGPVLIRKLSLRQIGQPIRDDGPQSHLQKAGTPTMGGALIITTITISTLICGDLSSLYVWLVLFVLVGYGIIGWLDDYRKLMLKNSKGLSARAKLLSQLGLAIIVAVFLYQQASVPAQTALLIPFVKSWMPQLGMLFIGLTVLVIVGSSNAVNLTDGLDGLAIMPTVMVAGALGIFAYLTGNVKFAEYLAIPYISGAGEVAVVCGAVVGAGLGFLWFNTYPAQIFMGDVGALGLGAALGCIAVIIRQELVLVIMGGIFVLETLSVIMQVFSYKLTGKRIFKMAPIHHHFELKGWPEPKVIVRFWIITVVLVLCGLATLKIR